MGWAGGSAFVSRIAKTVLAEVGDPIARRAIYDELVHAALDGDCDTLDECMGIDPELDAEIKEQWSDDG